MRALAPNLKYAPCLLRACLTPLLFLLDAAVKALLRTDWLEQVIGWRNVEEDRALYNKIAETQSAVHAGFCNNFDTPAVVTALGDLVTYCNIYLARPAPEAPAMAVPFTADVLPERPAKNAAALPAFAVRS